jgi:hypothetical protein
MAPRLWIKKHFTDKHFVDTHSIKSTRWPINSRTNERVLAVLSNCNVIFSQFVFIEIVSFHSEKSFVHWIKLFIIKVNDIEQNGPMCNEKKVYFHSIPLNSVRNCRISSQDVNFHLIMWNCIHHQKNSQRFLLKICSKCVLGKKKDLKQVIFEHKKALGFISFTFYHSWF